MGWMRPLKAIGNVPELLLRGRFSYNYDGVPVIAEHVSWRKRFNLVKVGLDALMGFHRMHALPPIIQVEPTNVCNLRCPLCPTGANTSGRAKGFMTLEVFRKILEQLGDVLIAMYLYGYGEPFMNKNLHKMIEACTLRNIVTLTSTNGHFVPSLDEALRIVDAGLTTMIIAVDGSTQPIYEKYRKSGELDRVKRSVSFIEEAKLQRRVHSPYTVIRSVVMKHNQDDIPHLERMARELGVDMFTCKTVGCSPNSEYYEDYEPSSVDSRRFSRGGHADGNHAPVQCPFPFRQPTIFWDGTTVGSEHDNELELPLGNICTESFSAIWNSPNAIRLRQSIREGRNLPLFCDGCTHRNNIRKGVNLSCKELKSPAREGMRNRKDQEE